MTGSAREVIADTKLHGIGHVKDDNDYTVGFRVGEQGADLIIAALERAGYTITATKPSDAVYDAVWNSILELDPTIKSKLSIHQFRMIIELVRNIMLQSAVDKPPAARQQEADDE